MENAKASAAIEGCVLKESSSVQSRKSNLLHYFTLSTFSRIIGYRVILFHQIIKYCHISSL